MTYTWRHQKRRYHVPPARKRYNILSSNFRKLKRIDVIFANDMNKVRRNYQCNESPSQL